MPTFSYKAARGDGQVVEGKMEAHDRDGVVRSLQAQGNIPIQIESALPAGTGAPAVRGGWRPRQSASTTVDFFTLELSTLLRAGLPLTQALDTLSELVEDPALTEVIQSINKAVRGGRSCSEAVDLALERLASFRANRRELRQSLISALIYPAILLIMAIVAVAVLLAFVVPQFTQMFADAGRDLPLLTRIVSGAGELVTHWWWLILLVLGGLAWWLRNDWQSSEGRARWDARLLKTPMVGALVSKLATARFTRTLSSLLENGVHLVPALDIARQIVGNVVIAQALSLTAQRVREGMGLAAPLAESQAFPALATQLIRVGESSGRLEMMLAQVADIYEREVQTSLKRLLTLAEPVIIITIALVITVIILSVVLMILESNDLAF
jgi:general secretion pathway protein F